LAKTFIGLARNLFETWQNQKKKGIVIQKIIVHALAVAKSFQAAAENSLNQ
jgi:hypothetical protein